MYAIPFGARQKKPANILPNRSQAYLEPVSSTPNTEIGKRRAETAAVYPGTGEPEFEVCRPETPR